MLDTSRENEQADGDGGVKFAEPEVVVAEVRGRSYYVPRYCEVTISSDTFPTPVRDSDGAPKFTVSATVTVRGGRPMIVGVGLAANEPLAPQEMQRVPWGVIAEAALVANAAKDTETRRLVQKERERKRAAEQRRQSRELYEPRKRQRVDESVLAHVLALKHEARERGERSWSKYAARRLHLNEGYVRQLGMRAERELRPGRDRR